VSRVGSSFIKLAALKGRGFSRAESVNFKMRALAPEVALARLDAMKGRPSAAKAACVTGPNGMAEAMPLQSGPRDK